jgi:archaea-specific DNA-binding protein
MIDEGQGEIDAAEDAEKNPMSDSGMDEDVVYVGLKPSMAYALGVIAKFSDGRKEVSIRARGKAISRAVDVAEIVRKRFVKDVSVKSIDIGTEQKTIDEKNKVNVSTINILLSK